MALRGNLQSFQSSELLQFLTHSGKTGTLRVYDEDDTKYLAFKQGRLHYAIHQRPLPRLQDIILNRSLANEEGVRAKLEQRYRWDDVVSRALSRRRHLEGRQPSTQESSRGEQPGEKDRRLGSFLLSQGRLGAEELRLATQPEGIPDDLLEVILKEAGLIQGPVPVEDESDAAEACSLLERVLKRGLLNRDDVSNAVLRCPDECLAEVLVAKNVLGRAEARLCLRQLQSNRGPGDQTVRLGEYLVVTGQLTQRQLERALEEQFTRNLRLGEILIERGLMTAEHVQAAVSDVERLRGDFGPLYPLRQKLVERGLLSSEDFDAVLFEHERSNRTLSEIFTSNGEVTQQEITGAIQAVVIEELCDLLLWTNASFEFLEDISLENAAGYKSFPEVHAETFDVPMLLLEAHACLDELKRAGLQDFSLLTVFVATSPDEAAGPPAANVGYDSRSLLRSLDGRSSLREVRQVFPGNRFRHFQLLAGLLEEGLIRPLSRQEASCRGEEALRAGRNSEALVLFRHSLAAPGDRPSHSFLQDAIREARRASTRGGLQRVSKVLGKTLGVLCRVPVVQEFMKSSWVARGCRGVSKIVGRSIAWFGNLGRGAGRRLLKCKWACEDFLIRTRLARPLWALRTRAILPLKKLLVRGRHLHRAALLVAVQVAIVVLVVILWPRGQHPVTAVTQAPRVPSLSVYRTRVPIEVLPTLDGDRVLVCPRDGTLRALSFGILQGEDPSKKDPRLLWKLQVGEFGDILSRPTVAGQNIFLASVRGTVHAVSREGEQLWTRGLSRLEPLEPCSIYQDGFLVGVVVVARESVHVLSPQNGLELYRWKTGNRILTRPVTAGEFLFVGSSDNHIYKVDWRRDELVWEFEETNDIVGLVWVDGLLVYATRDGHLAALDGQAGNSRWSHDFPRNSIRHVEVDPTGRLFVGLETGRVEAISVASGGKVSTFVPYSSPAVSRVRFHADRFFFASESGQVGEMDWRGEVLWRSRGNLGSVTGWIHGENFVAVTNRKGNVTLFPRFRPDHDTERMAQAHE